MKLGMVTYQWGAEWDLPTIFRNCKQTGYEGVELRT
jgi:sugar phosphate isomerase/epimerase